MKTTYAKLAAVAAACAFGLPANAALTGFVNNPTGNSTDWLSAANGLTSAVVTVQDFDAHAVGALVPGNFSGMTMAGTGDFQAVTNTAGPGNPGGLPPQSNGEGVHGVSNVLFEIPPAGGLAGGTLVVTFDATVAGFGLMTVDTFTPQGRNTVTLEAFDGPNATGNSLGSFNAAQFNFQQNKLYFMGLISDSNDIRSVSFTNNGGDGDRLAIDHLTVVTVPEPSSALMLTLAAAGIVFRRRR